MVNPDVARVGNCNGSTVGRQNARDLEVADNDIAAASDHEADPSEGFNIASVSVSSEASSSRSKQCSQLPGAPTTVFPDPMLTVEFPVS